MQPTGWGPRSVRLILVSRWYFLAVAVVITPVAAYYGSKITIDTSLETWFVEDDDELLRYQEFRREFGEDEFVVLAIEAEELFRADVFEELGRLTQSAGKLPLVRRATSMSNVEVLQRVDGSMQRSQFFPSMPETSEQWDELRRAAHANPYVGGALVSPDDRAAAILVELSRKCDTFARKASVVRQLADLASNPPAGINARLAGTPVIGEAISRYIERDLRTLTPVAFTVVGLAVFLLFRRPWVPVVSTAVVGLAALWVLGVMGALGVRMNLLGSVLVMVILVVGVADSVHIFAAYFQELNGAASPSEAIERALTHVITPCIVTSLTTVAGFLSLMWSQLEPIRTFGVLAALGTVFALLLSLFLIPVAIQLASHRPRATAASALPGAMDRLLIRLGHPSGRTSWAVMLVFVVSLPSCFIAAHRIEVTANPMNYFFVDDPVRQDAEVVERVLGGAASLEFIVRAPESGLIDVKSLRKLEKFENWLLQRPSVTRVLSLGTLLKEADRARSGSEIGHLPRSNISLLLAKNVIEKSYPDLLESVVREDFSMARISVRVRAADADRLASQAPDIEEFIITKVIGPDLDVRPTGFIILNEHMRTYLINSLVQSLIIAFVTITIVLWVLFRSWKLALFSMIPNLGPILFGLAFMAVLDIRLDPGTVMIATIALGLVVDDTCHFLVRMRQFQASGCDLSEAIAATMQRTGRPIILTSVILATGFAMLVLGSFMPTYSFGVVSAFVLIAALASDLIVLPAALLVIRPKLS